MFQKQRAAGSASKTACLFNSTRFGRAGAFAKEFPLEALGRVHSAIEDEEGTARAPAGEVNDAADLLAAGAGFSLNEHRTVFVRRPADVRPKLVGRFALADDLAQYPDLKLSFE